MTKRFRQNADFLAILHQKHLLESLFFSFNIQNQKKPHKIFLSELTVLSMKIHVSARDNVTLVY